MYAHDYSRQLKELPLIQYQSINSVQLVINFKTRLNNKALQQYHLSEPSHATEKLTLQDGGKRDQAKRLSVWPKS